MQNYDQLYQHAKKLKNGHDRGELHLNLAGCEHIQRNLHPDLISARFQQKMREATSLSR